MSENKKYYYLKLKDNYFNQDNIKIIEAMKNGHTYSLIILKLYLKSCKYEGKLMMTDVIPYNPKNVEMLATILNHDIDHVKEAIRVGEKLDLITILETGEIWMTDIQNFVGHSTTEADRIRKFRKKIQNIQLPYKCTPELEIEKDIEIEKELDKELNTNKNICDFKFEPRNTNKCNSDIPAGETSIVHEVVQNNNNINNNNIVQEFDKFWIKYNKKIGKDKCFKKWLKLNEKDKLKIFDTLDKYLNSTPDIQFRKNPFTYLNQQSWNDEIIVSLDEKKVQVAVMDLSGIKDWVKD